MKIIKSKLLLMSVALCVLAHVPAMDAKTPMVYGKASKQAVANWVDSVMNTLSPRERAAQLFMPTLRPENMEQTQNEIVQFVKRDKVGGFLLSKGTAEEVVKTVNDAQNAANVPLLVSVDGEWGPSMRIKDAIEYPHNMALGAISDDKLIYAYGAEVARQCAAFGIHVNFAPVLDVMSNPDSKVLGDRPFGSQPENVARKGVAFSRGMEDGGVLSVAKHFPGHGSTADDSHKVLPVVTKNLAEMHAFDLVPFKRYINAGLGGVLTAHLSLPNIDNNGLPSSFCSSIVTDLLQRKMGFKGLVFTDALGMKGADGNGSQAVKAIKSGNDVLLTEPNVKAELDAVMAAVASGEITQERIDVSCRKILEYKYLLGAAHRTTLNLADAAAVIKSPQANVMLDKLWHASMTLFKDDNEIVPVKHLASNKVALVNTSNSLDGFLDELRLYADVKNVSVSEAKNYNTVIVAIEDNSQKTVNTLENLAKGDNDVVAVFFCHPYGIRAFAKALQSSRVAALIAYSAKSPKALAVAAEAVFGGCDLSGKTPVDIDGVVKAGVGLKRKANRLGFAVPEEMGVSSNLITFVDSIANLGVATKAFPGCQVLMAKGGKIILNRNYGTLDTVSNQPVNNFTMYDLASVSKATGTLPGIMKAYDQGLIKLETPISEYIPQLKGSDKNDILVRELLFHESAIPPSIDVNSAVIDSTSYTKPLFKNERDSVYSWLVNGQVWANSNARIRTDVYSCTKSAQFPIEISKGLYGNRATYDTIMHSVYTIPLRKNKSYTYSCVNFCLLMNIEENVTGTPHNLFVNDNFYAPLGSYHTCYRPLTKFTESDVAPTEQDNLIRHQMVRGYVHDETACMSGGVQGNAGLFSNAIDLAKLCQMWLNGGTYGGERLLSEKTVKLFTTLKSPTCRRGLGFDKPNYENPENSPTCEEATAATFGHLGFTGTVFWVDPDNDMFMIFLCNRVYPTRNNEAFNNLDIRPKLFQALYRNLLVPAAKHSKPVIAKKL